MPGYSGTGHIPCSGCICQHYSFYSQRIWRKADYRRCNVPAGTIISAYIDSELAGNNTIDEAGKYQLGVSGTEEDNGKKIVFKLGLVESEPVSVTYQHGAAPVELDLYFKGDFKGDFVPPVIETCSESPVYILNDGKDYSVVRAKVSDELSGVVSVTLDLTSIGGGVVSLRPKTEAFTPAM